MGCTTCHRHCIYLCNTITLSAHHQRAVPCFQISLFPLRNIHVPYTQFCHTIPSSRSFICSANIIMCYSRFLHLHSTITSFRLYKPYHGSKPLISELEPVGSRHAMEDAADVVGPLGETAAAGSILIFGPPALVQREGG